MKKKRWLSGLLAAAMIFCAGCSPKAAGTKATGPKSGSRIAIIGYLPITHALPVFEMKKQLEHRHSGVRVRLQKFSSWTDLMDALGAGRIDGASVLVELAMSAKNKGIDLRAVALGHRDGNVLVAANGIKNARQLKGKTIAIPSTQSSHYILVREALRRAGLKMTDVKLTQLSPAEMPSALAGGAIDAYCVAEPYGAVVVAKHFGHVLAASDALWPDAICCAFVLRGDFIDAHSRAAQRIAATYRRTGAALNAREAAALSDQYLNQERSVLKQSLKWIDYSDLTLTRKDYAVLSWKMTAAGIARRTPAYDDFVYAPKEGNNSCSD
ncbi:ABC transporter substrate-binding protein [Pseudoramibacter alactolyticus]|uniref:ABC transporter substrate-binding protein n=1 Tax=Pseudoramibacter alactolyticus TaxID=113287 RepID=UPI00248E0F39|nr:ABC transporter substrate-binding protein [Pseudoramibacter alactolyticus]